MGFLKSIVKIFFSLFIILAPAILALSLLFSSAESTSRTMWIESFYLLIIPVFSLSIATYWGKKALETNNPKTIYWKIPLYSLIINFIISFCIFIPSIYFCKGSAESCALGMLFASLILGASSIALIVLGIIIATIYSYVDPSKIWIVILILFLITSSIFAVVYISTGGCGRSYWCLSKFATEKEDLTKCEKTDDAYVGHCLERAIERLNENDVVLCDKVNSEVRLTCYIKFANKLIDKKICGYLNYNSPFYTASQIKEGCYRYYEILNNAISSNNPKKCNEINEIKDFNFRISYYCFSDYAILKKDPNVCSQYEGYDSKRFKDDCLGRLARDTNNISLCQKTSLPSGCEYSYHLL